MDPVASTGPESAKQRSRRIPLDYYRQPTRLDTIKWRLTLAMAAGAGIYVAWVVVGWLLGSDRAARQFSPAPVASVHATWNGQCAACHVPGASLRSDAGGMAFLSGSWLSAAGSAQQASDDQCRTCHAGPAHHENQFAAEVVSCAACHRDHQGKSADLTRVVDRLCTACHRDLARHRDEAKPSVASGKPFQNVTEWRSHPAFRSLGGDDPGRLKFNHALHLLPGQAPAGAKASAQKKWGDIAKTYWAGLMAGESDAVAGEMPVQLSCASCHLLDDATTGGIPALGAYMQPILFERHCTACHQDALTVGGKNSIPHGLAPAEIREVVSGMLTPLTPRLPLSPKTPLQPIPGKTPGENLAQAIDRGTASQLALVETELVAEHRCGKCHEFREKANGLMPAIEPTAIPSVWLRHARFDHAAHRAVRCYDCHDERPFTAEAGTKPPLDSQAPMIPNRDVCAKCHAPKSTQGAAGARFDCVQCHRYHGGDLGPHGKGAQQRGIPFGDRHSAPSFMSGKSGATK